MIAWIFRFIKIAKRTDVCKTSEITFSEFDHAEETVIKLIQRETFEGERDEKLRPLIPFLDEFGILRARTKVSFREETENFKFPIILPNDHPVVHWMIVRKHEELLHAAMFLQEIETWDVTDIDCLDHQEINKRIRHVQAIREQLKERFRIECLGQLREQTQRHRKSRPLTVGDVVVLENNLKNRTLWSLARIIELIPGKDGHVRVARLPKLKGGRLLRTKTEESTERELRAQMTFDPGERLGFLFTPVATGEATRSEGGKEGIPLDAFGRRSQQFERAR
ncbi:integrase catalytic domain-containing protein [Trichonephila clavata]|uniref:Integrase catalytic domain-containing protein n=1 Tax=Trichonephila clavata TaxID=2740835 RepID=A0A8X6FIU6_TRICU|nr:integrase catalytic domain-containing protein [Trichonephila clavata]